MHNSVSIPLNQLPLGKGNSITSLLSKISELLKEYEKIRETRDYDALNELRFQLYGMANEVFLRIIQLTYFGSHNRTFLGKLDNSLSKASKKLSKDTSSEAEKLKENILNQLNKSSAANEAEEILESLMNGSHPVFDMAILQSKIIDRRLNNLSNQYISLITFAAQADYLSFLHTGLASEQNDNSSINKGDIELAIELKLQLNRIVEKGYKDIYKYLKNDQTAKELLDLAIMNQYEIQGLFGIVGSFLGVYISKITNHNDAVHKVSSYVAAVELTEAVKKGLAFFSYLAYIKSNLSERSTNRWLSNEKRRTNKRKLSSGIPVGKVFTINELINHENIEEGILVQIEGLVTSIEIKDDRRPPKFSTFVVLSDIQNNSHITLRAHMFGLEDNGLSVGSYLRVNGFVRRNVHWLSNNQIGLDIDRINLTELGKDNWLDDITKRMRDFYLLYKDGMNMFFTLN